MFISLQIYGCSAIRREKCGGITVNSEKMDENAHRSYGSYRRLHIGYENATELQESTCRQFDAVWSWGSLGLFTENTGRKIDLMAMTGGEKVALSIF